MATLEKKGKVTDLWFDDLVATIRSHQIMLETNVAPADIKELYSIMFASDSDSLNKVIRESSSMYFIKKLVIDYINELKERIDISELNQLALQLSDSQILVWAEIKDDDEKVEDALLLAEARINANFMDKGFHLTSTILEESDNYPIPDQFSKVI